MAQIGIKLADGSFYPVLEDDSPHRKRMTLTVARDGQTSAQIDLLRMDGEDHQYVGCLVLEDLPAHGATELELIVGLDGEGNVDAQVSDSAREQYQSLSVNLASLDVGSSYSMPDEEEDAAAIGAVDSLEDIALPDDFETDTPFDFDTGDGADAEGAGAAEVGAMVADTADHDLGALDLEAAYADAPGGGPDSGPDVPGFELDGDYDADDSTDDELAIARPPRPFSALVLAAVLLIGLSLVALGAFAMFQWLQTEPLPEPRAASFLLPVLLRPLRPRRS